jgi:hypothetical protein
MASSNVLSGLYKWLGREEWREPFDELLDRHLADPCQAAGIELDQLADVIGDPSASVVWGCVFEDFLACDLDDGGNIVDDYLKRRGWKESVPNKRYMAALRSSVMSLYEVSDIVRDQSFLARDLLRGGEPVRISEKSATHSLKPWDRLAARVVPVGPRVEMAGGALPFSHELGERIRAGFAELKADARAEALVLAQEKHGGAEIDQFLLDTEMLSRGAFLFTNIWLGDVLQRTLDPRPPTLVNSDGEKIAFTTVRYPLKESVDRAALEDALTAIPVLHRASENHWNWVAPAPPRRGGASAARAPKDAQAFVSLSADGSVNMEDIELEADALKLEANSPTRAQTGRALLEPAIGRFVGEPVVESRTIAEIRANQPTDEGPALASGLSPEEESALIHETLERHYRGLLDEPVPMLGDVSPRKAAKTKKGREKLVACLKLIENGNAQQKADSPMARYDVTWMWEELGIAHLRR